MKSHIDFRLVMMSWWMFIFLSPTLLRANGHPINDAAKPLAVHMALAAKMTGTQLQWQLSGGQVTAVRDMQALQRLPQSGAELEAFLHDRQQATSLPRIVNESPYFSRFQFHGHHLIMTDLRETPQGFMADYLFSVVTPEDQVLYFSGKKVQMLGMGTELCQLTMNLEEEVNTNDPEFPLTIKGSMNVEEASFVTFSCDGFENFQLLCEYRFPKSMLIPVNAEFQHVRANFTIVSTEFGSFMGDVTIDPFEINGVDDVQFEIESAVVDYSTGENHAVMLEHIDPNWPANLTENYENVTWRGFFLKKLHILLPEGLAHTQGERISISVENVFADHGSGVTAKLAAQPGLTASASGWGITLDELAMEVIANSLHDFKLLGNINIPIMTGTSPYTAMFTYPKEGNDKKAEISFTLELDGTYTLPFLGNSALELNNGSNASITYINGKFEPQATLHGQVEVSLSTPSITLPALTFENFKINDQTVPSFGDVAGKVTGGLDKVSIAAFGFGGIHLPTGGIGYGGYGSDHWDDMTGMSIAAGPNHMPSYAMMYEDENPIAKALKMNGFPITVKNIGLQKEMDGEKSCYKLVFDVDVNFAKGVNAFQAKGGFGIWGTLDVAKLLTSEPWKAVSYHKTTVEKILIDADLGRVAIKGGINIIQNDPVYGTGFKGAIAMEVKLPTAGFIIQSVGQFGTIPETTATEDYRYFFVDAEVGFSSGLQLGNTGLAIYGFSGGFFYNMQREGDDPAAIAGGLNVSGLPTNIPPDMSGDLLTPGRTLSGVSYIPSLHHTSFQVGMIFGLAAPQTLLADATFGMDFNTENGFAVEKIYFEGGAYIMNKGVADRRNAASVVQLKLIYDINNSELVGNFGMAFTVPTGAPPEIAIITGNYNTDLTAVNVYFKFTGEKKYFFYAGTPTEPMKINFQLTKSIKLGNINAYFMTGTQMPDIPTLAEVFAAEGYHLPDNLQQVAGRRFMTGDKGVAFGARMVIPEANYSFLMFRASLKAMAGFDASMMHYDQALSCGSNGSFGMNNWYMQGQAYGAFQGALSIKINLLFFSGTYKIAELEAGAALQAQLPNPTWMMGFIYGRYSILGNRIKGKFTFKVDVGEACDDLPEYNPLAAIPIIQDVSPTENSQVEIYQSPSVTFFTPVNTNITVPVVDNKGKTDNQTFQCFVQTTHTKLTKKGSTTAIPFTIKYQDENSTAIFQPNQLLSPNTDYEFTIRVGWKKITGSNAGVQSTFEEKKITFKTGDRPQKIIAEAIGYHAPGQNQRYWHKNYARPMLEFKQKGWDYLFPTQRNVSLKVKGNEIAEAFVNAGWTATPMGDSIKVQKNIDLKYVCRLKNIETGTVQELPVNQVPEHTDKPEVTYEIQYVYILGIRIPVIVEVKDHQPNAKIVRFDDLNTLSLAKNKIYSLEIVQTPSESTALPVTTTEVATNSNVVYNDTLEVYTQELTTRTITPIQGYVSQINALLADNILYENYHFGVSNYEHIRYKYYDITHVDNKMSKPAFDISHPDETLINFNFPYASFDNVYGFTNPTEPFDIYDQAFLLNNLSPRKDGVYGNPVIDYLQNQRQVIDLVTLPGNRANANLTDIRTRLNRNDNNATTLRNKLSINEMMLQREIIPLSLYFPENNDGKEYYDQTSVTITPSGQPSYWYSFKSKKHNIDEDAQKLSYSQYKKYVNALTDDPRNVKRWSNSLYFNPHFETLTPTEITTKKLTTWAGNNNLPQYAVPPLEAHDKSAGNRVMWVQNRDARIVRNLIQLYRFQAQCLDVLSNALVISRYNEDTYKVLRNYYLNGTEHYLFMEILGDLMNEGNQNLLKTKELGLRLRFTHNQVPEYMHSPGNQDGNTRGVKPIQTNGYKALILFSGTNYFIFQGN